MKIKDAIKFFSQYNEEYDIMVLGQNKLEAFKIEPFALGYYISNDGGETGQIIDPSDYFVKGETINPALFINANTQKESAKLEAV